MDKRIYIFLLLTVAFLLRPVFAEDKLESEFESSRATTTAIQQLDASEQKEGKNCVMVCERYGEDCVINPKTGTKKCRRTCMEMGQECF